MIAISIAREADEAAVAEIMWSRPDRMMGCVVTREYTEQLWQVMKSLFLCGNPRFALMLARDVAGRPLAFAGAALWHNGLEWSMPHVRTNAGVSDPTVLAEASNAVLNAVFEYAEQRGYRTCYEIVSAKHSGLFKRMLRGQPSAYDRYEKRIEERVPAGELPKDSKFRDMVRGRPWQKDLLIRSRTLRTAPETLPNSIEIEGRTAYWDAGSLSVTVPGFLSQEELIELNRAVNKLTFAPHADQWVIDADGRERRNQNYFRHRMARLWLDASWAATTVASRTHRFAKVLNERYWQFNLETDFARADGGSVKTDAPGMMPHFMANQFGPGDSMSSHTDYRPGCDQAGRKLAVTLQLTRPAHYEGGNLRLRSGERILIASRIEGTAIFLPAFIPHEVSGVLSGVRRSLVYFFVGERLR